MAFQSAAFPQSITVTHSPIKIGVIHGHQCIPTGDLDSLSALARQMDVDVLVSGHTHTCVACSPVSFATHTDLSLKLPSARVRWAFLRQSRIGYWRLVRRLHWVRSLLVQIHDLTSSALNRDLEWAATPPPRSRLWISKAPLW